MRDGGWTTVSVGYPYRLRGLNQTQTDTGLLYQGPSYKVYGSSASSATSSTQRVGGLQLGGFSLHNRSASASALGIGVRIPNHLWQAGQWVDATTTYTDDTTDAQDAGTTDFALETTTNNDGFVILSRVPFNAISIDITTASATGTVARTLAYSNSASTQGWTTITNALVQDGLATHISASTTHATECVVAFHTPVDWAVTASADGLGTGILQGYYALKWAATDAPGTAAVADSLSIYSLVLGTEAVADNSSLVSDAQLALQVEGDALVALFDVSNVQNRVTAKVRAIG